MRTEQRAETLTAPSLTQSKERHLLDTKGPSLALALGRAKGLEQTWLPFPSQIPQCPAPGTEACHPLIYVQRDTRGTLHPRQSPSHPHPLPRYLTWAPHS